MKVGLKNREGSAETVLRHENGRLKKLVADLSIANDVLKEHLEGTAMGKSDGGVTPMVYEEVANSSAPKLANIPAPLTTPSVADGTRPPDRSLRRPRLPDASRRGDVPVR